MRTNLTGYWLPPKQLLQHMNLYKLGDQSWPTGGISNGILTLSRPVVGFVSYMAFGCWHLTTWAISFRFAIYIWEQQQQKINEKWMKKSIYIERESFIYNLDRTLYSSCDSRIGWSRFACARTWHRRAWLSRTDRTWECFACSHESQRDTACSVCNRVCLIVLNTFKQIKH